MSFHDDPTMPSDITGDDAEDSRAAAHTPSLSLRFGLEGELGRGGMGTVYIGRDQNLNREVAIKVLNEGLDARDDRIVDNFMFEAEILGQLEHPGVIPVYERGALPGRGPFYAMKRVRGKTLQDLLAGIRPAELRTPAMVSRHVATFVDACRTVGFAHSRGIVHRDLKPANIMRDEHGNILVVDWGLAFDVNDPSMRPPEGSIAGTPVYMAPEQAEGRGSEIGPASDVFALGAILYEMLAGRRPFDASDAQTLRERIVNDDPVSLRSRNPAVPRALEAICLRALAKSPGDRYPTARELAADLENWRDDLPLSNYQPTPLESIQRWVRRRPRLATASATAAILVLVAGTVWATLASAERREQQRILRAIATGMETMEQLHVPDTSPGATGVAEAETGVVRQIYMDNLRTMFGTYIGRVGQTPGDAMDTGIAAMFDDIQALIVDNAEQHWEGERHLYAHYLAWNAIHSGAFPLSDTSLSRLERVLSETEVALQDQWGADYVPPQWEHIRLDWAQR